MELEISPDPIPGIADALAELATRYRLAVVSDAIITPGRNLRRSSRSTICCAISSASPSPTRSATPSRIARCSKPPPHSSASSCARSSTSGTASTTMSKAARARHQGGALHRDPSRRQGRHDRRCGLRAPCRPAGGDRPAGRGSGRVGRCDVRPAALSGRRRLCQRGPRGPAGRRRHDGGRALPPC